MDLVLRVVIVLGFVYVVTRAVGKRELSSLEPFDVILLVVIGDLVQQGITQNDFSVTGLMLAGGTISLMAMAISYGTFKFPRLRPLLDGEPVILVEDGKLLPKNLGRERITEGELLAQARLEGLDGIDGVRFAVLETNGQISFIRKSGRR